MTEANHRVADHEIREAVPVGERSLLLRLYPRRRLPRWLRRLARPRERQHPVAQSRLSPEQPLMRGQAVGALIRDCVLPLRGQNGMGQALRLIEKERRSWFRGTLGRGLVQR